MVSRRRQHGGMTSHRMAHPDRIPNPQSLGQGREILAKTPPVIRWIRFAAAAMSPEIERNAAPPAQPCAALPDAAYVGHYANAYVGDAFVVATNGGLKLELGPNRNRSYPLSHFDRDVFLYFPDAETPDRPYSLSFAIGADGRAARMTAESLNQSGLGVLERAGN